MRPATLAWLAVGCLLAGTTRAADDLPQLKFNEAKEIAPGVFFRYSSISAVDKSVPFGGSNATWVIFEDYVAVVDANFPKEAGDTLAAIRKTTTKPIRYVLDTHHHGDHAYGNAVWVEAGASIVAHVNCARILRETGPKDFAEAGRGPTGRKDIANSVLKVPTVVFDDKLVLDDGKQRIEFYHFGHSHTSGDAVAYLPKHKILCTGDACVNGAYNYMGQSDSASWIRSLEKMQQLDVRYVCPGHGPLAGKDLLERQKRYFAELRKAVEQGLVARRTLDDIKAAFKPAWYKEWTGVEPSADNVKHVHDEFTGRVPPWDLEEDFGVYAGITPTKDSPGWTKPRRIVVPSGLMPARIEELKGVAPEVEFIPVKSEAEAAKVVGDADAVLGFYSPEIVRAGKQLRWMGADSAGVEHVLSPELVKSKIVLTNVKRLYSPTVADQAFALLLTLTRGIRDDIPKNGKVVWHVFKPELSELHGKTLVLVGLGGVGTQAARRARAFGMTVRAVDPTPMDRPAFVFSLDKPDKLMDLLPQADVVMLCAPLTPETRGLMGTRQFAAMKKTAYFINVAHGGLVKQDELVEALKDKKIAGAGLDVTEPEPLPLDHPLWAMSNVTISPHNGAQSPECLDRQWRLWRENVRRFAAGEPLLCVVDKERGY